MEPLFQNLIVAVVPQPRQVPPPPLVREDLHRLFSEVTRDHAYAQFSFLPGDQGAQFANSGEDAVIVQPGLARVQTPVMTREAAGNKATSILQATAKRLQFDTFIAGGIKVIATVPAPGAKPDAKGFVTEQLIRGGDQAQDLGPNFFGGGVKYRSIDQVTGIEEVLLIEPFVNDNTLLFVDYDVQRNFPFKGLDELADWIEAAFSFVAGPTMGILEV
ncbi:MAG: hypothetical protein ACJ760_14110 [Thermoleophilaceae bacterium]